MKKYSKVFPENNLSHSFFTLRTVWDTLDDDIFNEIFHPIAVQLIDHCDAILRIGGPSAGADEMVQTGKAKNKTIFYRIDEIPPRK